MAGTQIRAERTTLVVDGTNKYQIIATCLLKGTLPDTGIFLMRITTPTDPKDDRLERIISIQDTVSYRTSRADAITAGVSWWRASQLILQYDDVATANRAWSELSARINKLVTDVDTYLEQFETFAEGELVLFPTTDQTTKDQLIAAFLAASEGVSDAEATRDAQQAACNSLKNEIEIIDERLVEARADLDAYLTISAQLASYNAILSSVHGTLNVHVGAARSAVQTSGASAPEKALIESYHVAMDAQLVTFGSTNSALATLQTGYVSTAVSTLQARVAALSTELNTKLSQLNNCSMATQTQQAALDRAKAARDAALAAVRAVCPDYTPPSGA